MEALLRKARVDLATLDSEVDTITSNLNGVVYAAAYGVSTSNTAAANTTAMNAAISAANAARCPIVLPRGRLEVNALSTINGNSVVIMGRGGFNGTALSFNNATGDCLTFSTSGYMGIRDVYITSAVRRTSGYAIKVTGGAFQPIIRDVRIDYHWNGVWIDHAANVKVDKLLMRYMHGTVGVNVQGSSSSNVVTGCVIFQLDCDNPYPQFYGTVRTWTTSTAYTAGQIISVNGRIYQCSTSGTSASSGSGPNTIPGTGPVDAFTSTITDGSAEWKFVCNAGLFWVVQDSYAYSVSVDNSSLINGAKGYVMRDTANTGTSYPMWFNNLGLEIDHTYDNCVELSHGEGFYASQAWWGSSLQARAFLVDSTYRGEISIGEGTRIVGNWLDGGLVQAGPTQIVIANCFFGLNSQAALGTYNGVTLAANVTDITIGGCHIGRTPQGNGQQGYGIGIGSGGARRIITGNNLTANHVGGASDTTNSGTLIFSNNLT